MAAVRRRREVRERVGEERAGEGFVQGEDDRADEYKQEQEGVERRAERTRCGVGAG